ncbi:hypothetical protein [Ruminococcus sp.]|uniref:hypothetical protein n=1 Tax=Ruminococcus sp. TaxID=41978 RepID=UPI003869F546
MMRKLTAILCILTLCACFLSACGKKADGAMEPLKDENGAVTGYERKYHNDNGDVTRWDVYDANQQYDHYVLYEYDSNNRLAKETYYQASGIGVYYYAYSYNDSGKIAEEDFVSVKEGSTRTLYDADGHEEKRYTYDRDDQLIKYEVYQNDTWVASELPTEAETTDTVDPTAS